MMDLMDGLYKRINQMGILIQAIVIKMYMICSPTVDTVMLLLNGSFTVCKVTIIIKDKIIVRKIFQTWPNVRSALFSARRWKKEPPFIAFLYSKITDATLL